MNVEEMAFELGLGDDSISKAEGRENVVPAASRA